jgi:hypothetical protein
MALSKLTLTSEQTMALLRADPFRPMTWARQVVNSEDAFAFAVHTGIVNIEDRPLCPCGQRKYLTIVQERTDGIGQKG